MPTVLIVEDHADIRRLIRWALEFDGFQMHEAANGTLGLQMAHVLKPDVLIVDRMMPGEIDGLQLVTQLRANPSTAASGILMLSARAQAADREAALQAGADAFMAKPFSPIALATEVAAVLKRRQIAA